MAFLIDDLWSVLLLVNYLALAAYFLYRYMHPEGWFIKSTISFFLVYALTLLVLLIPAILGAYGPTDILLVGGAVIVLALIILVIKGEIKEQGTGWMIPLFLYLASIGQEAYYAADAQALGNLIGWYFLGPLFVMILAPLILNIIRIIYYYIIDHFCFNFIRKCRRWLAFASILYFP